MSDLLRELAGVIVRAADWLDDRDGPRLSAVPASDLDDAAAADDEKQPAAVDDEKQL